LKVLMEWHAVVGGCRDRCSDARAARWKTKGATRAPSSKVAWRRRSRPPRTWRGRHS